MDDHINAGPDDQAIEIISASAGQYQGQQFAEDYGWWAGWNFPVDQLRILSNGPDHPQYTETWVHVLDHARYTDLSGNRWHLEQGEGAPDLWLVRDGFTLNEDDDDEEGTQWCRVSNCLAEVTHEDVGVCDSCWEAYELVSAQLDPVELAPPIPKGPVTNDTRASFAAAAIATYRRVAHQPNEPDQDVLGDLLTDLRHWAASNTLQFGDADNRSFLHWLEEHLEEVKEVNNA